MQITDIKWNAALAVDILKWLSGLQIELALTCVHSNMNGLDTPL